jgi:hypothetical protein
MRCCWKRGTKWFEAKVSFRVERGVVDAVLDIVSQVLF